MSATRTLTTPSSQLPSGQVRVSASLRPTETGRRHSWFALRCGADLFRDRLEYIIGLWSMHGLFPMTYSAVRVPANRVYL